MRRSLPEAKIEDAGQLSGKPPGQDHQIPSQAYQIGGEIDLPPGVPDDDLVAQGAVGVFGAHKKRDEYCTGNSIVGKRSKK